MMKNNFFNILIGCVLFGLVATNGFTAERLWVSGDGATLKASGSASAANVANLNKGTALTVLELRDKWYKVKTADGRTGWIYRGKVSQTQPAKSNSGGGGGGLGGLLGDLSGSDIEAKSADSSRSIRGLSPEAAEYAKQTGTPAEYQKALDSVLDRKIADKEVDQFLKDGRIGEYAD